METFAKAIAAGIVLFNLLGVMLGYGGLHKLKALDVHPFDAGLAAVRNVAGFWIYRVPDWILLTWDSRAGSIAIWFGCLVLPALLLILIFYKEKRLVGWIGFAISAVLLGFVGSWIFLDALLNAA